MTLYTIHYSLHYSLYTIHYTLYTIHYTLYTIHYTLYPTLYTINYMINTIYTTYTRNEPRWTDRVSEYPIPRDTSVKMVASKKWNDYFLVTP